MLSGVFVHGLTDTVLRTYTLTQAPCLTAPTLYCIVVIITLTVST